MWSRLDRHTSHTDSYYEKYGGAHRNVKGFFHVMALDRLTGSRLGPSAYAGDRGCHQLRRSRDSAPPAISADARTGESKRESSSDPSSSLSHDLVIRK